MSVAINYAKGDLRRMLVVLSAVDALDNATMVTIGKHVGLDKRTVVHLLEQASTQAGVQIDKQGAIYRIVEWGPLLNKGGAQLAVTGQLGT